VIKERLDPLSGIDKIYLNRHMNIAMRVKDNSGTIRTLGSMMTMRAMHVSDFETPTSLGVFCFWSVKKTGVI